MSHGERVPRITARRGRVRTVDPTRKETGAGRTEGEKRTYPGMAVPLIDSELELEGELDGPGSADLVEGVEASGAATGICQTAGDWV
jgi:hypothetical protein